MRGAIGTFHFVDLPVHDPDIGLMLVFQDVSPIYLKVNFQQWLLKEFFGAVVCFLIVLE
jgi:hypothetical protein